MNQFNIAGEGGGGKGHAFLGAYAALQEFHIKPNKVVGSSAASIFFLLISLGYKTRPMTELLREKDEDGVLKTSKFLKTPSMREIGQEFFKDLFDFSTPIRWVARAIRKVLLGNPKFRHIAYFIENGGWYSDKYLNQWLIDVIERRKFDKNITFQQLYKKTGIFFTVMVTDTTNNRILALNSKTSPNIPVRHAVRMSVNIPFLWGDYEVTEDMNMTYMNEPLTGFMSDGGVLTNFPINMIADYDSDWVQERMELPTDKLTDRNIGLLCDETLHFTIPLANHAEEKKKRLWESPTIRRIKLLVSTLLRTHDKRSIKKYEDLILHLPVKGISTLDFNLDYATFSDLYDSSYSVTKAYLEKHL